DGTGVFHVAPTANDRGDYSLQLDATDNGDGDGIWARLTTNYTFIVSATVPNVPPVLDHVGDKVAVPGQAFALPLRASDTDQEPPHFPVRGLPVGVTIVPGSTYGTATLNWTPGILNRGNYTATITVTDEGNGTGTPVSDSETIHLVVRDTDAAPAVPNVSDK